jgi:hypothetical protein
VDVLREGLQEAVRDRDPVVRTIPVKALAALLSSPHVVCVGRPISPHAPLGRPRRSPHLSRLYTP